MVHAGTERGAHWAERAAQSFAQRLKGGIEVIYWKQSGETMSVWSVLAGYDRVAEDRVFEAEAGVLAAHPELRFDFRILYRHGRTLDDVRPSGARRADCS